VKQKRLSTHSSECAFYLQHFKYLMTSVNQKNSAPFFRYLCAFALELICKVRSCLTAYRQWFCWQHGRHLRVFQRDGRTRAHSTVYIQCSITAVYLFTDVCALALSKKPAHLHTLTCTVCACAKVHPYVCTGAVRTVCWFTNRRNNLASRFFVSADNAWLSGLLCTVFHVLLLHTWNAL